MLYWGGMAVKLAILFCFYSVLGWTIDTAHRSWRAGRFTRGGFSKYPFSPIYGLAGVFIVLMAPVVRPWPLPVEWFFFAVTLAFGEYIGGRWTRHFFKRRLWDYTKERWDLNGHTTPVYAAIWATLALLVGYVIQPILDRLLAPLT